MSTSSHHGVPERMALLQTGGATLAAVWSVPPDAWGAVVVAHAAERSCLDRRNRLVADVLHEGGFATLLLDLLTPAEEEADEIAPDLRFDIGNLARRLHVVTTWLRQNPAAHHLPIGYLGGGTAAAAALVAAAVEPDLVQAIVARGGRPDLAGLALMSVHAPTLLTVGGRDALDVEVSRRAFEDLDCERRLEVVAEAGPQFDEPGALGRVAALAGDWFGRYLAPSRHARAAS